MTLRCGVHAGLVALALLGAQACTGVVGENRPGSGPGGSQSIPTTGGGGMGVGGGVGAGGAVGGPSTGGPCSPGASLGPSRVWRITDEQYVNAVAQVFGVRVPPEVTAPDTQPADYTNLSEVVTVDARAATAYEAAARTAAGAAVATNLAVFLPCGTASPADTCVESFIRNRVARAFRRPLTDTEVQDLMGIYHAGLMDNPATGIRLIIEATLQAPSFLYRTELGAPVAGGPTAKVALTAHELATAVSFALLDSVPDDGLWQKAQDGTLLTPSVLSAEIARLLVLPAVQANLSHKAGFWLGVERMHQTEKETTLFPEFTEALKQNLYDSAQLFIRDIFTHGGVSDLLSSRRMYVNDALAKVYGIPGPVGKDLVPMDVQLDERSAGILTQPAILAAFSRPTRGDPIHRGLFIYNSLICGSTIPAPPANALAVAATFPANATERQLADLRAKDAGGCGACHGMFDPLGLSTERYDPIGRYKASDAMGPIDSSATLARLGPGLDGPISGLPDLVSKLKTGRRVSDCAASNLAVFVLGRSVTGDNSCALQAIKDSFATSGAFIDYYHAMLTSPGFMTRDGEQ
jgi:hypothetical protein